MRTAVKIVLCLCLAGGVVAAALVVRAGRPAPVTAAVDVAEAASRESVEELRGRLAMLTARLDAAERRTAAPPAAVVADDHVEAPRAPAKGRPAAPPFATHQTPEQERRRFDDYFASIDAVRGGATDGALVDQMTRALRAETPDAPDLRTAHFDLVDCGNGLCRVELTFADSEAAGRARTQLTAQAAAVAPQASVFASDRHVSAYFATPGASLPPFPSTDAVD
jgi:hypothetical protein